MPETMIPILPCPSIREILDFYRALGFEVIYQQERPNTYAAVRRGEMELHFFVLKGLDPTQSYSTCYVVTDDVDTLYERLAAGLRGALGRVPARGVPRVIPLRDLRSGMRQFTVVDPGGNYVRIGQQIGEINDGLARAGDGLSHFERAVQTATTFADSKDDPAAAARVLDRALEGNGPVGGGLRYRALVLRADVAARLGEEDKARAVLGTLEGGPADEAHADDVRRAAELRDQLRQG